MTKVTSSFFTLLENRIFRNRKFSSECFSKQERLKFKIEIELNLLKLKIKRKIVISLVYKNLFLFY